MGLEVCSPLEHMLPISGLTKVVTHPILKKAIFGRKHNCTISLFHDSRESSKMLNRISCNILVGGLM
jgi:hypothetical protein